MSVSFDIQVDSGSLEMTFTSDKGEFVQTRYHDAFLAEMVQSHLVKHFCLVGSRVSRTHYGVGGGGGELSVGPWR